MINYIKQNIILLFFILLCFPSQQSFAQNKNLTLLNIKMVSISGKGFIMGYKYADSSDAKEEHKVTLEDFEMSITEITQGQYKFVMGTNPSNHTGDENLPVENVSWYDAIKFCNKLSDIAGFERCYNENTCECDFSKNGYRFPTEAEWEYACSGNYGPYRKGWFIENSGTSISEITILEFNLQRERLIEKLQNTTHIVGQLDPNSYGIFDMLGNVFEWCNDWYDPNYYNNSESKNPQGPLKGTHRVIRGGSYASMYDPWNSSRRQTFSPNSKAIDVGFRVVRGVYIKSIQTKEVKEVKIEVKLSLTVIPEKPKADSLNTIKVFTKVTDIKGNPIADEEVCFVIEGYLLDKESNIISSNKTQVGESYKIVNSGGFVLEDEFTTNLLHKKTDKNGEAFVLFRPPNWSDFMKEIPIQIRVWYHFSGGGNPYVEKNIWFLNPDL